MDSCASVSSCSSSSGEISSAKPVKVHTCHYPFPGPLTRGPPWLLLFLDAYEPACTGRLVDPLYYRERLAPFLEVYERLATLSDCLDEVLYLVAVRHGEAARIRAGAWSGPPLAVLLHDLFGLVLASARAVGLSLLTLSGGVKVGQFIVVDDGRSPISVHGDPRRESRICRRRRHYGAEGAVRKLQDGYRRVFDLDPLVGKQPRVGCNFDYLAHQPLEEVDAMDCLVDQDSPTIQLPGSAPAARVVVRLRPPPPHVGRPRGHTAELSSGECLVNGLRGRVEAVLAYDGDPPACGTLYLDQAVRRPQGNVDGLFDHDVLAGLEHRYGALGVNAARGTDAHGVEIHTRKHLFEAGVMRAPILICQLLGQFGHDIGHGHQLRTL